MKSFLDEVAQEIISSKYSFEQIKIIVPSRRATLFLKNALATQIDQPQFAPEIISIESFVEELSGLEKIAHINLLYEFYEIYQKHTPEKEQDGFDAFLGWASIVLADFNEMDAHLVDAKVFFEYQASLHEMQEWAQEDSSTPLIKNHLNFWKRLPLLYERLNDQLYNQQKGMLGMLFREAVANLEHYTQGTEKQHFFVGFNALNKSESQIIQEFVSQEAGIVIWDIDRCFFEDGIHSAGKFIRKYYEEWSLLRGKEKPTFKDNFCQPKNINLVGVTKNIAQAKYAAQLAEGIQEKGSDEKTAVVLGNESLLIPALSSLSVAQKKWNVTMGYPLEETTAATFFDTFLKLHSNVSKGSFYFKNLQSFFTTAWCDALFESKKINIQGTLSELRKKNLSYVSPSFFLDKEDSVSLSAICFKPFTTVADMLDRLVQLSEHFILFLESQKGEEALLHLAYFQRFKQNFNQMILINQKHPFVKSISLLVLIFKELTKSEKIDFVGEPLMGIQFMGLLETRLLDFDNIIITNLNEGILPAGKKSVSFLPFDLKKKFGLPTFVENDAIYTYHFYRLLQRAKNVYLLYNTESDGLNAGEKSRFLHQLIFEKQPNHKLVEQQLTLDYQPPATPISTVVKNDEIMNKLNAIAVKGFSPSSLSLYLRDPLAFYYQRVLGISETQKMENSINNMDKGTLVHEVVENLYTPFIGKILTVEDFDLMFERLPSLMEEKYKSIYHGNKKRTGRNYIVFEVLQKSVIDLLSAEQKIVDQGDQLKVLYLEKKFEKEISIPGVSQPVKLIGVVDRIDELNGILRIIDYKTGRVNPNQLIIPDWDLLLSNRDYAYLFQILVYSYVHPEFISSYKTVEAGIISFRNLPSYFMKFSIKFKKSDPSESQGICAENLSNFEKILFEIILEIFDQKINFNHKN